MSARRLPLSKILHYSGKDLAKGLAEPLAPIIAETAKQGNFSHVVAAHAAIGKNVLPRVAGLMDISQVSRYVQADGLQHADVGCDSCRFRMYRK